MRISTNTMYQSGINRISELQSSQVRLQEQISTQRRILTPSDDPVGAARVLELSQAQSVNNQYINNRQVATRTLNITEGALGNISELLLSVKSSIVAAGNGAYSDQQRSFLATELQGSLDQLIGLANTTDGAGSYIFSGFQTQNQAFVSSASGATYQGDSQQRTVQVSASRQMEVSDTGDLVFQGGGNDIFAVMRNVITLLQTPVNNAATSAALTTGLQTANTGIEAALDNVLVSRSKIGSRLKELDGLETFGQQLKLEYSRALAEVQDLDYAQAVSDISLQKTILEIAQKTYAQTAELSLFNFI